tara:strand:+ start:997 stop:1308 length:312 start_codon:yes stop_codon:yes gene_type:complete
VNDVLHLCYHVDIEELVGNYVTSQHYRDIVLIVYNPAKYIDYLKDLGFFFDETKIHFDKILVVLLDDIGDGIDLINLVDPSSGPICSLWVDGNKVTDNIEENL